MSLAAAESTAAAGASLLLSFLALAFAAESIVAHALGANSAVASSAASHVTRRDLGLTDAAILGLGRLFGGPGRGSGEAALFVAPGLFEVIGEPQPRRFEGGGGGIEVVGTDSAVGPGVIVCFLLGLVDHADRVRDGGLQPGP